MNKKKACGSQEDLNRDKTCYKIPRTLILPEEKTPAAAEKTSTELIHVIRSRKRNFFRKTSACGSREDLNKAYIPIYIYMHIY